MAAHTQHLRGSGRRIMRSVWDNGHGVGWGSNSRGKLGPTSGRLKRQMTRRAQILAQLRVRERQLRSEALLPYVVVAGQGWLQDE